VHGQLPTRYQVTIWIAGLLLFGSLGAWLALSTSVPLVWRVGAVVGLVVGAVVVAVFTRLIGTTGPSERRT